MRHIINPTAWREKTTTTKNVLYPLASLARILSSRILLYDVTVCTVLTAYRRTCSMYRYV